MRLNLLRVFICVLVMGASAVCLAQSTQVAEPTSQPAPGTPAAMLLDAASTVPRSISIFPRFGEPDLDELIEKDHPVHDALLRAAAAAGEQRSFDWSVDEAQADDVQRLANVCMLRATRLDEAGHTDDAAMLAAAALTCARFLGQADSYPFKRREIDVSHSAMLHISRRLRKVSPGTLGRISEHLATLPPMIAPADVLRGEAKRLLDEPEAQADVAEAALTPEQVKQVAKLFADAAQVISLHPDQMQAHVTRLVSEVVAKEPQSNDFAVPLKQFLVMFGKQCTRHEVRLDLLRAAVAVAHNGPDSVKEFRDYFGDGPFEYREVKEGFEVRSDLAIDDERLSIGVP